MQPFISVIVPVYKVEPYLNKCIDSIVNQTYQNLEIILVDDGSPDRCPQICDEWAKKDPRIQVIHKKNGGIASARNAGLDAVTGSYIAWVDSDDWIERHYIAGLYDKLNIYSANISINFRGKRKTVDDIVLIGNDILKKHLMGELGFTLWATLADSTLYTGKRFHNFQVGEDMNMLCEIYAASQKAVLFYLSGYHYLTRNGSATNTFDLDKKWGWLQAIQYHSDYIQKFHPTLYRYVHYSAVHDACVLFRQMRSFLSNLEIQAFRAALLKFVKIHVFKIPILQLSSYQLKEVLSAYKILVFRK